MHVTILEHIIPNSNIILEVDVGVVPIIDLLKDMTLVIALERHEVEGWNYVKKKNL